METSQNEKEYNSYLTNRALSFHLDTILYAQEMNLNSHLDNKLKYDYLFHSIPKRKRYGKKWPKKLNDPALEFVKEYFKYSDNKAIEAINTLGEDQIDQICRLVQAGKEN